MIVAGDLLQWKRTDLGTDYANGSYTLSYKARLEGTSAGSSVVITITASASGDDYLVSVGQSTTASYAVGDYNWQAYITRNSDSERLTIDSGTFEDVAGPSARHPSNCAGKVRRPSRRRLTGQPGGRIN
jgi:hypothetical protein